MSTLEQTLERIESSLARIAEALENAHPFKYTPEGDPICPRHHEPMKKREKQGDTWYSHTVTDPATGEVSYCRGYPGKSSPGWSVATDAGAPAHPPVTTSPRHAPRHPTAKRPPETSSSERSEELPTRPQGAQQPVTSDLSAAIRELKGGRS